jgi:drug/metabolite transporter (DMT)-like permease
MLYESLVLASEVVLSAYPILIKKVDASVFAQTGVRMATFAGLAAIAASVTGAPLLAGITWGSVFGSGLLNLLHVGASYSAFEALPAGNAMALFYTYPIWNVLGAAAALGESIPLSSLPWMGLAALGAVLLSKPTATGWSAFGIAAAVLAALTETGIYLWFRKTTTAEESQPWTNMFRMYGGSALLWVLVAVLGIFAIGRQGAGSLQTMLLFNALVGFVGYGLRFYMIPKVSTVVFSMISFFGVIAAYLFGWVFMGEVPSATQGLGAAAIIAANAFLLRKENV